MSALLAPIPAFLDAHGTAIHVLACATVFASFAFVAGSVAILSMQRRRSAKPDAATARLIKDARRTGRRAF